MNASSILNLEGSRYGFVVQLTFEDAAEVVSLFTEARNVVCVDHDRRLNVTAE